MHQNKLIHNPSMCPKYKHTCSILQQLISPSESPLTSHLRSRWSSTGRCSSGRWEHWQQFVVFGSPGWRVFLFAHFQHRWCATRARVVDGGPPSGIQDRDHHYLQSRGLLRWGNGHATYQFWQLLGIYFNSCVIENSVLHRDFNSFGAELVECIIYGSRD